MLVCHCNVVSDRAIRAAVDDGACDLDGVTERCGAGGACGGCIPGIEALLADAELAVSDPVAVAELQAERRCARERQQVRAVSEPRRERVAATA